MKTFKFVLVEKLYAERSEAKKKQTEQLKEGLKSSILGPQNLGWGGPGPPGSASEMNTNSLLSNAIKYAHTPSMQ